MSRIFTEEFSPPVIDRKEIFRYAGGGGDSETVSAILDECLDMVKDKLSYKVCYTELDLSARGSDCDFGVMRVGSRKLAQNLTACKKVLLFGATVGIELDRLISKYSRVSVLRASMLQAIGAERIEALCDVFCDSYEKSRGVKLKPRFSPGYGDLPLNTQKQIFEILDCQKRIGLYLTDSMLMRPTKSVTAFAGIKDGGIYAEQAVSAEAEQETAVLIDCISRGEV